MYDTIDYAERAAAWATIASDLENMRVRTMQRLWLAGAAEMGQSPREGWTITERGTGYSVATGPDGATQRVYAPAPLA